MAASLTDRPERGAKAEKRNTTVVKGAVMPDDLLIADKLTNAEKDSKKSV